MKADEEELQRLEDDLRRRLEALEIQQGRIEPVHPLWVFATLGIVILIFGLLAAAYLGATS